MNSCKVATERQVQWALLAMQIGLAVALWAMREEDRDEHNKASNCEDVASGERDKSLRAQACCDAGLIDKKSYPYGPALGRWQKIQRKQTRAMYRETT